MATLADTHALVPGFAPADYAARMCNACASCGTHALDADADLCPRCAHVAGLVRAWGSAEIRRRLAGVEDASPAAQEVAR